MPSWAWLILICFFFFWEVISPSCQPEQAKREHKGGGKDEERRDRLRDRIRTSSSLSHDARAARCVKRGMRTETMGAVMGQGCLITRAASYRLPLQEGLVHVVSRLEINPQLDNW
jgi:hypothetical protein